MRFLKNNELALTPLFNRRSEMYLNIFYLHCYARIKHIDYSQLEDEHLKLNNREFVVN